MPEPTDVIVPILQRIQGDVAQVKRTQAEHGEKLDSIESYLTYALGIQATHTADIESLKEQVADIKRRLAALEEAR